MNTYCSIWAVKVQQRLANEQPQPGQKIEVTTKAGKVKVETVDMVIGAGTDNGVPFHIVTTVPKAKEVNK